MDLSSSLNFSQSLKHLIRNGIEDHVKRRVPFPEFVDWFIRPKLHAIVRGKPFTIHPPRIIKNTKESKLAHDPSGLYLSFSL